MRRRSTNRISVTAERSLIIIDDIPLPSASQSVDTELGAIRRTSSMQV